MLQLEVVAAFAGEQACVPLRMRAGSSVREAVDASGLLARFPQLVAAGDFAIHGHRVSGDEVLEDGDRVEILRPLQVDPKEARRRRARLKRRDVTGRS